jgi:predicted permease
MEKAILYVVPVLGIAVLGYLVVRFGWLSQAAADGLGRFVIAVAVPLLAFRTMTFNALPKNLSNVWELLGAYYLGALAVFVLAMVVARVVFHASAGEQGAYGTLASYSNTALLGLPAVVLILGGKPSLMSPMLLIGSHGLLMAIMATTVLAFSRGQTGNLGPNLWRDITTHAKNPILLGLIAGILVNKFQVPIPTAANRIVAQLSNTAVPCALFAAGGMMARYNIAAVTQQTMAISALKLAAHPLLVWVLAKKVFSVPTSWTWVAVMLATMPIAFDIPRSKGEGDGATIGLSTLLGVIALTALAYIIVVK